MERLVRGRLSEGRPNKIRDARFSPRIGVAGLQNLFAIIFLNL